MNRALTLIAIVLTLSILACGSSSNAPSVSTPAPNDTGEADTESPTSEPAQSQVGLSRDNPAPAGSEVSQQGVTVVVKSAEDYTAQVAEGNMFNATPEPGTHYLLVTLSLTCGTPIGDTCNTFPTSEFSMVGDSGNLIDASFVAGVSGTFEMSVEQLPGATAEGGLLFVVPEDETLLLVWSPMLGDTMYLEMP